MKAINLKTEYLKDPMGIDITCPRLMWNCEGGIRQTAYRIVAAADGKEIWDSGKVSSSFMRAEYPLKPVSRQRVEWSVTLWDEEDNEGEKACSFFEYGLLAAEDWTAKWITGDYRAKKKPRYPVDCFKKTFAAKKVVKARLYATACGLYEICINGKKAGDFVFAPGSTDYRKRVQYQTYDVTPLLQEGENIVTAQLADGWFRGSNGAKGRRNTFGTQTKLLAQLELYSADGKITRIITDESWAWSNDGPVRFADLKDGERVDARLTPSYAGKAKLAKFEAEITASDNVAVREMERFAPAERIITPSGRTVLKFPQNLAGYISFRVKARAGQRVHVTLGEMLDENGELTLKNIQCIHKGKKTPLQEIDYICKEGVNEYTPKFFFGGFQYAEVTADMPFEDDDFAAVAVYSAFEETSSFKCSHPLINKFYEITKWSLKSNSIDIPTDCPTRERMGWTGDSEVFFNTASYMTDYAAFARKHVRDIYDRQWKSGRLPQIAPFANEDWFMWVMNGSVGWACAGVYIPLYMYRKYGDRRILEENYQGMLRYADFMINRAGKWGGPYARHVRISRKNKKYFVNRGQSYGEWAEPEDVCAFQWYDFASPHPEESTAYTFFTLKRVLEVADILGKPRDARLERIEEYSEGARRAYRELVTLPKFSLDTDRQAKLVRPLYMRLLDKEQSEYAKKRLIEALDNYGWRLGTGFLSTPFILEVLAELDVEYAYRLLENEELPGWLAMPKNGATTIWEAWEGNTVKAKGLASLNHYSKGAVCEWFFSSMCGINVGGENKFVIKPLPGGSLAFAKAEYKSVYGTVSCGWEKRDGGYVYEVRVPANTTARLILPDGREQSLNAGEYKF